MKLRTVHATRKSCVRRRSVREGWPKSIVTAFRFLIDFLLATGLVSKNSSYNPLDYVKIKPCNDFIEKYVCDI